MKLLRLPGSILFGIPREKVTLSVWERSVIAYGTYSSLKEAAVGKAVIEVNCITGKKN